MTVIHDLTPALDLPPPWLLVRQSWSTFAAGALLLLDALLLNADASS